MLEKMIVVKLDNEEYLPNEDGGTSPLNQVHEAFLYPNFEIFLRYKCILILILHSALSTRMQSVYWQNKEVIFGERMLDNN